jgi:hypothetical protein
MGGGVGLEEVAALADRRWVAVEEGEAGQEHCQMRVAATGGLADSGDGGSELVFTVEMWERTEE